MKRFFSSLNSWKFLSVFIAVCLIIVFFSTHFFRRQGEASPVVASTTPKASVKTPESKTFTVKEHASTYDIDLTLPKIIGNNVGDLAANKTIKNYFYGHIAQFKKGVEDVQKEERTVGVPSRSSSYFSDASVVSEDDTLISFVVSEFFDFEGSAHPSHTINTFVFDKKQEKLITLSDIFVVNDSFYKKVSGVVAADLAVQLAKASGINIKDVDTKWIRDGLSEKEKSFTNFTIDEKGVTFYFDQYVVASYAEGPQETFVSFEVLKEFKK